MFVFHECIIPGESFQEPSRIESASSVYSNEMLAIYLLLAGILLFYCKWRLFRTSSTCIMVSRQNLP